MKTDAGYRYLDDIAVADVAFEAVAPDLSDLFTQAARATTEVMLDNPADLAMREHRSIALREEAVDMLLFDFLQELIYYKDADRLLLLPEQVDVTQDEDGYRLTAELGGEPIDPPRHQLNADVKAVALYRFRVEPMDTGWRATVVLDV